MIINSHHLREAVVPKTILVVDDKANIRTMVSDYLTEEFFRVVTAEDGQQALYVARHEKPDLILLDIMMPKMGGYEFLRAYRKEQNTPVILLTAKIEESDKVLGLELGADDYITKPFSPKELVARVRTVLRRTDRATSPDEIIRVADLTLDVPRLRLTVGDNPIELTTTEFQLLTTLARQPGRIFTRSQLLDAVHGIAFESYERAIDAHVKNIRRKIEPNPREPRYILTMYGMGYKFADE